MDEGVILPVLRDALQFEEQQIIDWEARERDLRRQLQNVEERLVLARYRAEVLRSAVGTGTDAG